MRLPPDLEVRNFYSSAPPAQTYAEINPTLLVSWWCTGFSLVIILFRLAGRWIRTEKMFLEDKIMALGVIPLLIRMGFVHLVLHSGTNNAITSGLSHSDIVSRELGSKLVLPARIFYAVFLWTCKLTIAEFLQRLYSQRWEKSWDISLKIIRWFLLLTFCAVVIATLTECQPFHHYWQVVPDPGPQCRQGYAQLMGMGISDIISDLVLVMFPVPIVISSSMRMKRKFSLSFLFSLSLILVGITIYRIYGTVERHGNQQFRSLVASAEILAATAVSNALVLGSFVRDRGVKKAKFKFGSVGGESAVDRPATARTRTRAALSWGSDSDLVGDMGMRLGPEFQAERSKVARPAPAAIPLLNPDEPVSPLQPSWEVPARDSLDSDDENDLKARQHRAEAEVGPHEPSSVLTPRRMSFFDVGGLLGSDPQPQRRLTPPDTPASDNFSIAPLIKDRKRQKSPFGRGRRVSRGVADGEYNGSFKLQDLKPRSRDSRRGAG